MGIPVITEKCVKPLLETRFIKVYDLQYEEGRHYYNATRRSLADLVAIKSNEAFQKLLPDAVTLCVILRTPEGDRLLTFYEYRYPAGRFLLSPPAGLIDAADFKGYISEAGTEASGASPEKTYDWRRDVNHPICRAAIRELYEETGIRFREDRDRIAILNQALFSSPGMTDETNALALLIIHEPDLSVLTDSHAEGTEHFDGFYLMDRERALSCIREGRDPRGNFYSIYTWQGMLYFISDLWKAYL